jgi:hypothetical protein
MSKALTEDQRKKRREYNTAYQRTWRKNNREKVRSYNRGPKQRNRYLRSRYGITLDQQKEMLTLQGGGCAVCGDVTAAFVDHNHKSGVVRGILCNGCNAGLGFFNEAPERMLAAIRYLEKANAAAAH